jgi:hypothetical protein
LVYWSLVFAIVLFGGLVSVHSVVAQSIVPVDIDPQASSTAGLVEAFDVQANPEEMIVDEPEIAADASSDFSSPEIESSDADQFDIFSPRSSGGDTQSYFEADYLAWWMERSPLPPLLTTNPIGTDFDDAGPLDSPGAKVLIGNEPVGDWIQSGLRLRYGRYRPGSRLAQWEVGVWHLFENLPIFFGDSDDSIQGGSNTTPIYSRPYFNPATGLPDAQVLSYPGEADGYFRSQYSRRAFGVDPLLFVCLNREQCRSLDFVTGYRFLYLNDRFWLDEQATFAPDPLLGSSASFRVQDSFEARNFFHTIPIGLSLNRQYAKWSYNLRGEMGLGFVHQNVRINGSTDVIDSGGQATRYDGGLLALETNSGSHDRYRFAWVPQLSLNLQRQLTKHWSATAGYTLVNLNNAVKAADHIPTSVDPSNLPPALPGGTRDPKFAFADEALWIHGFNFGLRADY